VSDKKKYTTIADLLTDDGFLAWHLSNDKDDQFWNTWIAEKPGHAALAKQAVQLLSVITNPDAKKIPDHGIHSSFDRLLKKIMKQEKRYSNLL
jgi:hypothetical protein